MALKLQRLETSGLKEKVLNRTNQMLKRKEARKIIFTKEQIGLQAMDMFSGVSC